MRFMMMVRANKDTEAGVMPEEKLIAAMGEYNEELQKAGVLLDLSGLQPSSKGALIRFSGGKPTVIDGPLPSTNGLIAGYWLIQVNSKQEAIEWAKRAPAPHGEGQEGEIEIRQLFELDDFEPSAAIEQARELEKCTTTRPRVSNPPCSRDRDGVREYEAKPSIFDRFRIRATRLWYDGRACAAPSARVRR
jgi:hypothetical protein